MGTRQSNDVEESLTSLNDDSLQAEATPLLSTSILLPPQNVVSSGTITPAPPPIDALSSPPSNIPNPLRDAESNPSSIDPSSLDDIPLHCLDARPLCSGSFILLGVLTAVGCLIYLVVSEIIGELGLPKGMRNRSPVALGRASSICVGVTNSSVFLNGTIQLPIGPNGTTFARFDDNVILSENSTFPLLCDTRWRLWRGGEQQECVRGCLSLDVDDNSPNSSSLEFVEVPKSLTFHYFGIESMVRETVSISLIARSLDTMTTAEREICLAQAGCNCVPKRLMSRRVVKGSDSSVWSEWSSPYQWSLAAMWESDGDPFTGCMASRVLEGTFDELNKTLEFRLDHSNYGTDVVGEHGCDYSPLCYPLVMFERSYITNPGWIEAFFWIVMIMLLVALVIALVGLSVGVFGNPKVESSCCSSSGDNSPSRIEVESNALCCVSKLDCGRLGESSAFPLISSFALVCCETETTCCIPRNGMSVQYGRYCRCCTSDVRRWNEKPWRNAKCCSLYGCRHFLRVILLMVIVVICIDPIYWIMNTNISSGFNNFIIPPWFRPASSTASGSDASDPLNTYVWFHVVFSLGVPGVLYAMGLSFSCFFFFPGVRACCGSRMIWCSPYRAFIRAVVFFALFATFFSFLSYFLYSYVSRSGQNRLYSFGFPIRSYWLPIAVVPITVTIVGVIFLVLSLYYGYVPPPSDKKSRVACWFRCCSRLNRYFAGICEVGPPDCFCRGEERSCGICCCDWLRWAWSRLRICLEHWRLQRVMILFFLIWVFPLLYFYPVFMLRNSVDGAEFLVFSTYGLTYCSFALALVTIVAVILFTVCRVKQDGSQLYAIPYAVMNHDGQAILRERLEEFRVRHSKFSSIRVDPLENGCFEIYVHPASVGRKLLQEKKFWNPDRSFFVIKAEEPFYFLPPTRTEIESERLGRGAFATVVVGSLAHGMRTRKVAVKKIDINPEEAGRIEGEIEAMCHLEKHEKHINVVKCLGCFERIPDPGVKFRTMCFLYKMCGDDLKSWMPKAQAVLTPPDFRQLRLFLIKQLAGGLHHLHSVCQMVHYDIKPANLLLHGDSDPSDWRTACLKLADFGFAAIMKDFDMKDASTTDACSGTPGYIPPPPYYARPDPGRDIFAFGMTIWEIWDARMKGPFPSLGLAGMELHDRIHSERLRPSIDPETSDMPRYLRKLCRDCWSPDARARPDSGEIVRRLENDLSGVFGGFGLRKRHSSMMLLMETPMYDDSDDDEEESDIVIEGELSQDEGVGIVSESAVDRTAIGQEDDEGNFGGQM